MSDINDFFDFSKNFKRMVVSGGYLNGRTLPDDSFRAKEIPKREVIGKEYSTNLAAEQEISMLVNDMCSDAEIPGPSKLASASKSFMETLEDSNDMNDIDVEPNPKDDIYEKYNFTKTLQSNLPVFDTREEIVELIKNNRVVILEGDTGCGKTTQIPQFILDNAYKSREYCNIVCTQPRRIAAISIAQRVSYERNWEVGTIIGYQIGLHKKTSLDTRLLYCTTGILLQKLIKSKSLASYTHIILDEVHERDIDMDFLLIVIKKLLRESSTKIILMSATINTKAFSEYFKTVTGKNLVPAPILKVETRRLYNVKIFYIEDLRKITIHEHLNTHFDTPGIEQALYNVILKLIINLEILDESDNESQTSHKPSILIFLPGVNEIEQMEKALEHLTSLNAVKMLTFVIRLHSLVSPDEQQKVFSNPAPGYRKIILATNIAESSITVPDVKYVIDLCLTKNLVTDSSTNLTSLELQWASKSNCIQRAGRAGRVMNGRVFRLVTRDFYQKYMQDQASPEITRCPLENIILKAKLLDMGAPYNILGLALDPPNLSDIRNTILILKEVGALHRTDGDGNYNVDDGDLTFIGKIMAQFPIDIHVCRLIIFGYLFSLLEDSVIIAAGLNVKSIFDIPYQRQLPAYTSKLIWSNGSGSDLFAMINAYKVWLSKYEQGQFRNENAEAAWSRRFYINPRSMKEMHFLILELKSRLKSVGIKEITGRNRVNWLDHEKAIAMKVVIAGAFYPNYFLTTVIDQYEYERSAYQTLCSRNPRNTVFFTRFDNKYFGELYVKSVKDIFKKAMITYKDLEIDFEEGTQKIFVKFNAIDADDSETESRCRLSLPGCVLPEVYKAVKMRHIGLPTTIKVMPPRDAVTYATEKNLGKFVNGKFEFYKEEVKAAKFVIIPSHLTIFERGIILNIENCGKFWFRPNHVENQLKELETKLNNGASLYNFKNYTEVFRGMLVVAKHNEKYFRAKVIGREEKSKSEYNIEFKVIFIDFGDVCSINFRDIYGIKQTSEDSILIDLPPTVFECHLAGISPSAINSTSGHWTEKSTQFFRKAVQQEFDKNKQIVLGIYSVVNGICATFLQIGKETINDVLVEKKLAQYCAENYKSQTDNDLRSQKQGEQRNKNFDSFFKSENDEEALEENVSECGYGQKKLDIEPPPIKKCTIDLNLRGPFSPLEITCYSPTRIGSYKTVDIERNSVNSVLLNADPRDNHEKLIVAAAVSESVETKTVTARQTTFMPNIKGFAPLMALIFGPKTEMRRNKSKTKFSSIICGLGPKGNNSNESLFPEHDTVLNLNVDITLNDIEIINQLRFNMDSILRTNPEDHVLKATYKEICDYTVNIKGLLIKLLEKDRQYIEIESDFYDVNWNQIDVNDLCESKNIYGNQAIFPLHNCMRLYDEPDEKIVNLRKNCKLLHEYKKSNTKISGNIECKLCEQKLDDIMLLRIHLLSKVHKDREKQIIFF